MLKQLAFAACMCGAPMAQAHPHVFVDVALKLEANEDGQLTEIEVTWTYDPLFTLLILSDQDLDADADGKLTQAERATLLGFDLEDWPEGFEGALFVYQGGAKLDLAAPRPINLWIDEEGRLVTRHIRAVSPVDLSQGVRVQPYDPYYYAALSLLEGSDLPQGCEAEIVRPDTEAADALVAEMGWTGEELNFQEIRLGSHYADTLRVTCARS